MDFKGNTKMKSKPLTFRKVSKSLGILKKKYHSSKQKRELGVLISWGKSKIELYKFFPRVDYRKVSLSSGKTD